MLAELVQIAHKGPSKIGEPNGLLQAGRLALACYRMRSMTNVGPRDTPASGSIWSDHAIQHALSTAQDEGRPLPAQYEMPELSALFSKNVVNRALDRLTGTSGPNLDHKEAGWWINLVRLSDKSIREYEAARTELAIWIARRNEGHLSPYYVAIDHLENAVGATHRALLHAQELQRRGYGSAHTLPNAAALRRLDKFRNFVEHTEDKLTEDRAIPAGSLAVLTPLESVMEFGTATLSYDDLASAIREVYAFVESIRGQS